jgi:6-phospho-3-hexuloisomerase
MSDYLQQVDAIAAELARALHSLDAAALDALGDALMNAPRVFVTGKGRSGLMMRAFAMRLMHLGLNAHVVDDVTTPALMANDMLVIGSGSGTTPTLVRHAQQAKAFGARLALITTAPDSPIHALADHALVLAAASPRVAGSAESIQPMANLFEQSLLLALDILVMRMMQARGMTTSDMMTRHANLE